jgi:hypothetical protein
MHWRENKNTIKKNTETLIGASKEVGLEVNADKIKYMLPSSHQNAEQNPNIKIANQLAICFRIFFDAEDVGNMFLRNVS